MVFTNKVTGEQVELLTIDSNKVIYRELVWHKGTLRYLNNWTHYADVQIFLVEFVHNKFATVTDQP